MTDHASVKERAQGPRWRASTQASLDAQLGFIIRLVHVGFLRNRESIFVRTKLTIRSGKPRSRRRPTRFGASNDRIIDDRRFVASGPERARSNHSSAHVILAIHSSGIAVSRATSCSISAGAHDTVGNERPRRYGQSRALASPRASCILLVPRAHSGVFPRAKRIDRRLQSKVESSIGAIRRCRNIRASVAA